uniref:THAP-type domain-containing protein n=1 Tax=Gadus morhua TaxID=8049 RepID=A0A8C5AV66_GADMO
LTTNCYFPLRKKKRLNKWLKNINRKSWVPNACSRLCARHFTDDCLTIDRSLKPDAVPTLFGNPGAPCKVRAEVSNMNQEHNYCQVSLHVDEADEVQVNVSEATASDSAEHNYAVQTSPLSFKRHAENKLGSIRKKLRLVQQNSRKLKIKVSSTLLQIPVLQSLPFLLLHVMCRTEKLKERRPCVLSCWMKWPFESTWNMQLEDSMDMWTLAVALLMTVYHQPKMPWSSWL